MTTAANAPESEFKYYKKMYSGAYEYYKVYPDDRWDFWSKALNSYQWLYTTKQCGWCPFLGGKWSKEKATMNPIEVSKLEILLILGPEAINDDR